MPHELYPERPLFGGAISIAFPQRFEDASNIREVPDHQEVFVDPSRDESLIFELLDFKTKVGDSGSASWFIDDLAREQDAQGFKAISKGRQGREAQNLVTAYEPILINPLSESTNAVGSGLDVPASQSGICQCVMSLSNYSLLSKSMTGVFSVPLL